MLLYSSVILSVFKPRDMKDFRRSLTSHGQRSIIWGGFVYRMMRPGRKAVSWRCTDKRCPAQARTNVAMTEIVQATSAHQHAPSLRDTTLATVLHSIQRRNKCLTDDAVRYITEDKSQEIDDTTRAMLEQLAQSAGTASETQGAEAATAQRKPRKPRNVKRVTVTSDDCVTDSELAELGAETNGVS